MRFLIATNLEKVILIIVSLFAGIFIPAADMIIFALFLIFVDTLTGIWAANVRKEVIHSTRMKGVFSKLVLYPLMIILSSWAEYLLPEIGFLKASSVLLILVEGKSITENISDILGYDLINLIKAYIAGGKKGVMEVITKSEENRKSKRIKKEENEDQ